MKSPIACLSLFLVIIAGMLPAAEPPVKGTHVILTAPKGFVAADRFPGFLSEETGASIMVSELPAPFAEVTKGFTPDRLKKHGMTQLSKEDATFGEYRGLLVNAAKADDGVDFLKWLAVFGDEKTTYLVTASFPKENAAELSDLLKQKVLSARISAAPSDPFDALTFRITPAGDMKITKVIGNMVLLSKGGVFPAKSSETPILVAGPSTSNDFAVPDRKAFAEARLQQGASLKNIQIKTTEPIKVAGMDGYESDAAAVDKDSGTPMLAYQVILFDADGYYLIQGSAPERDREALLPVFKQIARSYTKVTGKP